MKPIHWEDYFGDDVVAVARLCRELRLGQRGARYLRERPYDDWPEFLPLAVDEVALQEVIPLVAGQALDRPGVREWHLLRTHAYLHPRQVDWVMELLGLEAPEARGWLLGEYVREGQVYRKPGLLESAGSPVAGFLELLGDGKSRDQLVSLGLEPRDLVWECVPLPPAERFPLATTLAGNKGFAHYHAATLELIDATLLMYEDSVGYQQRLHARLGSWMGMVHDPRSVEGAWLTARQLAVEEGLVLTVLPWDGVTELSGRPSLLAGTSLEQDRGWCIHPEGGEDLMLLDAQCLFLIRDGRLHRYELPDMQLMQSWGLPAGVLRFGLKRASVVYMLLDSPHHLLAFDTEALTFIVPDQVLPYVYQLLEYKESACLLRLPDRRLLALQQVGQYPTTVSFDPSGKYLWCLDKEGMGGVYFLATGCLVHATPVDEWLVEGPELAILSPAGVLRMEQVDPEEEFEWEVEYGVDELLDAPMDYYPAWQHAWRRAGRLPSPDCFGELAGDWLYVYGNGVYWSGRLVLAVEFCICLARFSSDSGLLYLAGTGVEVVLDIQDPESPWVIGLNWIPGKYEEG